jgi:outer membrane protein assembly factor BamE (lipoprotein component of BamABCDE complex)
MTNCICSPCHKFIYAIACVALLSLCACGASLGTVVTNDQLKDFKVGTTTYEQVVAKLGVTVHSDSSNAGQGWPER